MGFNGGEAGGDACAPGQGGVHRTDPLSLPLEKKGGGEKQSYLYEKLF